MGAAVLSGACGVTVPALFALPPAGRPITIHPQDADLAGRRKVTVRDDFDYPAAVALLGAVMTGRGAI